LGGESNGGVEVTLDRRGFVCSMAAETRQQIFNSEQATEGGQHTPARTLVISKTLYPFNGRLMSSAATSAKLLRRVLYNAERAPLGREIAREALMSDWACSEGGMMVMIGG